MNSVAKFGMAGTLALGAAAVGGIAGNVTGTKWYNGHDAKELKIKDRIDTRTADATREWNTWRDAAIKEFGPSLVLSSPENTAQLQRFLADHPAPAWINVTSDSAGRLKLSASTQFVSDIYDPADQRKYQDGFDLLPTMLLGGTSLAAGGVAYHAITLATKNPKFAFLGGAASGALAGFTALNTFHSGRIVGSDDKRNYFDPARDMVRSINNKYGHSSQL